MPSTVTHIESFAFYEAGAGICVDSIEQWCNIEMTGVPFGTGRAYGLYIGDTLVTDVVIPDSITIVPDNAFYGYYPLKSVVLPSTTQQINTAFANCSQLNNITYNGTVSEWHALVKKDGWNAGIPAAWVQCTDGRASLSNEPTV